MLKDNLEIYVRLIKSMREYVEKKQYINIKVMVVLMKQFSDKLEADIDMTMLLISHINSRTTNTKTKMVLIEEIKKTKKLIKKLNKIIDIFEV